MPHTGNEGPDQAVYSLGLIRYFVAIFELIIPYKISTNVEGHHKTGYAQDGLQLHYSFIPFCVGNYLHMLP